jgi:hypothetical protein
VFGISKTRALAYVYQVLDVLIKCYGDIVSLPKTKQEWDVISDGFDEKHGIPNIAGAIDGSLFQVMRYRNHEGWYCRKGFPAFNIQFVVDHTMKIMSYSIRSGMSQ